MFKTSWNLDGVNFIGLTVDLNQLTFPLVENEVYFHNNKMVESAMFSERAAKPLIEKCSNKPFGLRRKWWLKRLFIL